jgi:hypothetical protein
MIAISRSLRRDRSELHFPTRPNHLSAHLTLFHTLSAQQPSHPHVTIQNKVTPAQAKALHDSLKARLEPWTGRGESILVWDILGI